MGGRIGADRRSRSRRRSRQGRGHRAERLGVGWAAAAIIATVIFQVFHQEIAWRVLFFVGVLPALLVFYIRTKVPEPTIFKGSQAIRAKARRVRHFRRDLMHDDDPRRGAGYRRAGRLYAITTFLPTLLRTQRHLRVLGTGGYLAVIIFGSWCGYIVSAYLNDAIGRRKNFFLFAIGSLLIEIAYTQSEISDAMMLAWAFRSASSPRGFSAAGPGAHRIVSDQRARHRPGLLL